MSLSKVNRDVIICRLLRDENFIPNYEAAAYDAVQAGFIEKRYFWMVALASLCVRDNEAELEEELRDKICRIFHKINREPIQHTWRSLQRSTSVFSVLDTLKETLINSVTSACH